MHIASSASARRIVIATFGSLGDLHPFLALAQALQRRGHTITFATAPAYRQHVEALGLTFTAVGPDVSPEDPAVIDRLMNHVRGPEYLIRELFLPALPQLYAELEQVTANADLLISSEVVFAAPLLAEKTGLPWVSVLLSPISFFSPYDPPTIPPLLWMEKLHGLPSAFHHALLYLPRIIMRRWEKPLQAFRAQLGLRPTRDALLGDKFTADRVIALFSRHFAAPQRDWPAGTVQPGFAFFDQRSLSSAATRNRDQQRLEEFLEAGEPPVVFTLGSAAVHAPGDFFTESADAARRLGRRAVLVGRCTDLDHLKTQQILTVGYADYRALFPRAAVVVHQGGVGTTAETLRAGVPALVVPFNFDQPDNAARAARLGVARVLPRRRYNSAKAARELAHILSDARSAEQARRLAEAVSREDGIESAVDAIEAVRARSQ